MPGLAFIHKIDNNSKIDFVNQLKKFREIYKIPHMDYREFAYTDDFTSMLNIYPGFIKEDRSLKIGNLIILMDGDFYNEIELAEMLNVSKRNKLIIIKELYLKYNRDFIKYINGEFVILIYDFYKREIIISNDKFARRPAYYYYDKKIFAIASEKKALLTISHISKTIDHLGLAEVFTFRHNLNGRTFIKDIKFINPASTITISGNIFSEHKYFKWKYDNTLNYSKEKLEEEIYLKLKEAVKRRIKGKDRILLWLSGGFDSRSIAASIEEEDKPRITTETFGENDSIELSIAERVAERLRLKWIQRKIDMPYSKVAKFGSWRSEFAISALEHPLSSYHLQMKKEADYIISGLPGTDVLSGRILSLNVFLHYLNPLQKFDRYLFDKYSSKLNSLYIFFTEDFKKRIIPQIEDSFYTALNTSGQKNRLLDFELFNILNRQPHYSNVSDLVENDLFETLHPYADTQLLDLYLSIPFKYRIFEQLPKNMMFKFYPELNDIEYNGERGKLKKNNSISFYVLRYLFNKMNRSSSTQKTLNWDRTEAIKKDFDILKNDFHQFIESDPELVNIFDPDKLNKLFSSPATLSTSPYKVDTLFTFMYAYQYLFQNEIKIPDIVFEHYECVK